MKAWFPRVFLSFFFSFFLSPLCFLICNILSFSLSKSFSLPTPFLLRVPLDPVGAGSWYTTSTQVYYVIYKMPAFFTCEFLLTLTQGLIQETNIMLIMRNWSTLELTDILKLKCC